MVAQCVFNVRPDSDQPRHGRTVDYTWVSDDLAADCRQIYIGIHVIVIIKKNKHVNVSRNKEITHNHHCAYLHSDTWRKMPEVSWGPMMPEHRREAGLAPTQEEAEQNMKPTSELL